MSSEIRRRSPQPAQPPPTYPMPSYDESHLTAPVLLEASPVLSGHAYKLHMPAFYAFLPSTLQWVLSTRFCPNSWSPHWNSRYIIALGGYLYRFKDESSSMKGAPIPVDTMDVRLYTPDENRSDLPLEFPSDCMAAIQLSCGGKTQCYAFASGEEAQTWVNTLRQMRQDGITRQMGHSKVPYPKEWVALDAAAKRVRDQKSRIKDRLEAMDRREQEMQTMGGVSMGYFS